MEQDFSIRNELDSLGVPSQIPDYPQEPPYTNKFNNTTPIVRYIQHNGPLPVKNDIGFSLQVDKELAKLIVILIFVLVLVYLLVSRKKD